MTAGFYHFSGEKIRRTEVYEYTWQVFGSKTLPTCANNTLHQVVRDNAKDEENLFEDFDKSTLFRKWMYKLETRHLHRRVRRSSVHRDVSQIQGDAKTHLCGRKIPCSTYQIHDDSEFRISNCILRSLTQKAYIERTWCENWENLSRDRFIYSVAVVTVKMGQNGADRKNGTNCGND